MARYEEFYLSTDFLLTFTTADNHRACSAPIYDRILPYFHLCFVTVPSPPSQTGDRPSLLRGSSEKMQESKQGWESRADETPPPRVGATEKRQVRGEGYPGEREGAGMGKGKREQNLERGGSR